MKNLKLRMLSLGVAVTMPFVSCHMSKIHAEETDWTMASYMEENLENDDIDSVELAEYTVKKGDNSSRISEWICTNAYDIASTQKYWPVIAYINKYPRTIHPGNIIYYPKTLKGMEVYYSYVMTTGWYYGYVNNNHIYGNGKTLGDIINSIYGEDASADPEFVATFVRLIGEDPEKINAGTYYSDRLISEYPAYDTVVSEIENKKTK